MERKFSIIEMEKQINFRLKWAEVYCAWFFNLQNTFFVVLLDTKLNW